ncbi:hypothetical protein MTR_6g488250 [Medicago truncatula]|uniref:Uncharacterized protein n=1 Tax=Medicago truncatula TaxID=3880 RepID=G8A0M7_MEDTR|nr:hypothetical protein MTR_6g488250 [Medicago truncatula]
MSPNWDGNRSGWLTGAYGLAYDRPDQAFKQDNMSYQTFRNPNSGLKSKSMTGHMPDLDLQKNWQVKLRPYEALLGLAYSHPYPQWKQLLTIGFMWKLL